MNRHLLIIALSLIGIFFSSCVQTSHSVRDERLLPDGQPRYREILPNEARAYEAACRAAFVQLGVRRDIQIKGPVVYRDMADHQIVAKYHLGFISRFVTRFDSGSPPRITETYFEDYDTNKRTNVVPRSLKPAEQVAVADRHQHHCFTPTTHQSPGG
jgi:hypothetical protein